jgi:adenylate cyclase
MTATRRLAAILAADVVGYSGMIAADEAGTLARLRAARRDVVDPLMVEFKGRVFKVMGDGLLAEFPSAVQALRCAIAIQQRLREGDGLQVRIGLHQGDVVAEGGDLLGDGVNVAARLEALAEAGGICISARVREDAAGKMPLDVEDIGTPPLKNIAQPVHVFRVRLDPPARPALALPDKPSLAVLPFQNMSGDPEQEYFVDGLVEDITTALSCMRSLFVIARNSAFTYKGRTVDVRQVGRELGVRYVLEGSVRKAASRVRITGQLVEAASGANLWADRFDGTSEDVFALQDQVTASVVAASGPSLRAAEVERAQRKPTENLHAYDLMLRALPHYYARTPDSLAEAARLLRSAIEIDCTYAPAYAYLANCHWITVSQGWMEGDAPAVADMLSMAQAALDRDAGDPEVLVIVAGIVARAGGDLSGGIALIEKAIGLNPNSADAFQLSGTLKAFAGDTRSAFVHLENALRLNPLGQKAAVHFGFAIAHFVGGEHEAVVEWTGKALRERPRYTAALRYRAASLGLLGRVEEGRKVVQRIVELVPDFTVTRARRHIEVAMNNIIKTPGVADSFYEGLRLSGVPE